MSICTTTDVYSAASLIGQELQLLIDEHGPEDFECLMYRIIHVLEELEYCVSHCTDTEQLIGELQEQHDALKSERNDYDFQDFTLDLDLMQQSWYNETQRLLDRIAVLESENHRLKRQLENVEEEVEVGDTQPCVADLVGGQKKDLHRPFSLPIKPCEVDSLLAHTEERLLLTHQESRAADLQLIRLLKAGVINQAREIKETRQELLFIEFSIDAVEEEMCRLARESGQLMAARSPSQFNHLSSEHATLEAKLSVCEKKLEELSLLMGSNEQVESPLAPAMPLHVAPGEGMEAVANARDRMEEQDSLLALEQLRGLLYERNRLRCRFIELNAGLEAIMDRGEEGELVYGPLPREPIEKLFPDYVRPKSAIKALFVELLQRISERTS
ncbi:RILP protein 1 [Echinococcus multilocularis]|uniref:RILP protein 1 n=1 Tax=Echinococcus multilocularis TaxID=6211 RepID=A0A087VZ47_ECHMU|nr:RILP protein 1 [Echinococcus multilocularis]